MEIKVCIGSACHLKGSYEVVKIFKNYVSDHGLEKIIDLRSSFCLGQCSEAVSVQVNNEDICSVSPEHADQFIEELHRSVVK